MCIGVVFWEIFLFFDKSFILSLKLSLSHRISVTIVSVSNVPTFPSVPYVPTVASVPDISTVTSISDVSVVSVVSSTLVSILFPIVISVTTAVASFISTALGTRMILSGHVYRDTILTASVWFFYLYLLLFSLIHSSCVIVFVLFNFLLWFLLLVSSTV